ncbi:MAG: ribonuclease P protein component [Actinomycetota bacterium]|nr:ribonuclease P protein component [Actinomycetota bacterium]
MTSESLSRRGEFELLKSQGIRFRKNNLQIIYASFPPDSLKYACAVSKKAGNAVKRNKFRRRVREAFRICADEMVSGSYLVSANSTSITIELKDIIEVLSEHQSFLKAKLS